jgi:hypothetical protein
MRPALLLMLALRAAAAAPAKPDPCPDPRAALPGLVARALEHGEDKTAGPPQRKLLGYEAALKRLVFDGEPAYVLDVVVRPEPDGELSPQSLLLARMDQSSGALHRELYAATLKGELRGGAVFGDRTDEHGALTGAPTLHQPLSRRDPSAREAFARALRGLCLQAALRPSAQEKLDELGGPPDAAALPPAPR